MKKNQKIIVVIILVIISLTTIWLFYNQAIGKYYSDLNSHIEAALDNNISNYSILGIIYKVLDIYCGKNLGIAIFLTCMIILNIYVTKKLLEYYMKPNTQYRIWIYAILLNFAIAIYIPFIHTYWNIGVQEANEWHNSTYICMKAAGILAILLFLKIENNYLQKIDIYEYILFCIALSLVNAIKPNFILAFAPTMLIYLIIDFFKNIKNKKAIINIIIFGCAVLISLLVLVYQWKVLYVEDFEAGIRIDKMSLLKRIHKYPIISMVQSAAFPLFILVTNFKRIIKDRKYSFIYLFSLIALLEYLFLKETGLRAQHGNFEWGYSFSLMIAFITSVSILEEIRERELEDKKYYLAMGYTLLSLHILSGLAYFCFLIQGYLYF